MNTVKEEAFTVSFGKAFHSIIVLGLLFFLLLKVLEIEGCMLI